jgi:hypothetical protein
MTKLGYLGAALILSSSAVSSVPAMAQVGIGPGYYARNAYCISKEPGNPYNPRADYQNWTSWRAEGGWDDRGDWRCWYSGPSQFGY